MPNSHAVSYFAPPLAPWQQPRSFRTARYEPRKRRRESPPEGDTGSDVTGDETYIVESDDQGSSQTATKRGTIPLSSFSSTPARSSVLLTPDEAHQYRIAGHPMDRELPGGNFPHSIASTDRSGQRTKNGVETELSELRHPVFVPGAERKNLHLRHLAVVTTILHRCLMEGDYIRAGRAWGLLLREDFGGHPVDIRTEGRWGVGAEILLWISDDSRLANQTEAAANGSETHSNRRRWFSRDGFERAKSYYERLILQYPYRKAAPRALNPLHFYPAMYGLWIATVQEESQTMRDSPLAEDDNFDPTVTDPDDPFSRQDRRSTQVTAQSYGKELVEAQQIASQMDELLASFPFSDSYDLLRLRGMVSLWIADLHVSSVATDYQDVEKSFDNDGDVTMEWSIEVGAEEQLAKEKKTTELEKAQAFLDKANTRISRVSAPPP